MTTTKKPAAKTASLLEAAEYRASVQSRCPIIVIKTPETARVEPYLFEYAGKADYEVRFWDFARGFTDLSGKVIMGDRGQGDPDGALDAINENRSRVVWVLRDFLPLIAPPLGLSVLCKLQNLARPDGLPARKSDYAQSIVLIGSTGEIPPQLTNSVSVQEWPLPDRAEMSKLLDDAVMPVLETDPATRDDPAEFRKLQAATRKSVSGADREYAIDAAIGLTGEQAAGCFARSLVLHGRIDPVAIAGEKKRVIGREGIVEWIDPPAQGVDAVGGLDNVKDDMTRVTAAFTPEARAYGVQTPKGALLVGIAGCGKSLIAKCIAATWGVPLLRLDLGALKSKFVGDSEANLRKTLKMIEAIGRCVVWIDEVEKALAGATGEAGDGGVAADALGTILTWMQDRAGQAYVIATANDTSKLPPELLRKGRFDKIWWVDLPNRAERAAIVAATLRTVNRDPVAMADMDLDVIAEATGDGNGGPLFSGAEMASLVTDALPIGFADNRREITTDDLLAVAGELKPLMKTPGAADKIEALRKEWVGRAKPAAKADTVLVGAASYANRRQLDI